MIESLQGLRSLAMFGIFLFHSGLLLKGTFPVTFFFILSGFVLYYNYESKVKDYSIKNSIFWGIYKIKRLYPIHILTFIMSIFIKFDWILKFDFVEIFLKGLINILLLQSLFEKHSLSFNNASWFLSTLLFCYIFTLPLIFLIKNLRKIKPQILIILIWIAQIVFFLLISNIDFFDKYRRWFFYISPYFRISEFFLGMLVASWALNNMKVKKLNKKYDFYEWCIVIALIFVYILSFVINSDIHDGLYYSPIFLIGIYVFSQEYGWISNKILKNEILIEISYFSFEFYMLHELILVIFRKVFVNFQVYWIIKNIIIAVPAFIISMLLSKFLHEYLNKNKINIMAK